MKDVFLGIDLGTGGARAGLFDDEGHALAFKDSPVVSHYPHPGWVEQSAEDWWEALVNSVRAVVAATGVCNAIIVAALFVPIKKALKLND